MFRRMNAVIDTMESLLIEAQKAKGWRWVDEEPMWLTWSLEKFGKGKALSCFRIFNHHISHFLCRNITTLSSFPSNAHPTGGQTTKQFSFIRGVSRSHHKVG